MALSWSDVTVPTAGALDLRDFAEDTGHDILCAVGGTGLVYTTPDGAIWTKQTASEANNWRGVDYAPSLGTAGRLCAVASSGTHRVMTSDNGGVTWANQTASEANSWQAVRWVSWLNGGLGLFVAIASTGTHRAMTSPDGITWTNQTIASLKAWNGLAVSSNTLVAVTSTASTQQVVTSTDAVTWTLQTTSASSAGQVGAASGQSVITYSSTLGMFAYVAVIGAAARFINTSTDHGVTWVAAALPTNRTWTGIRWFGAQPQFLVVSQSATTFVASSTDGVSWTEASTGISNNLWDCLGCFEHHGIVAAWGQSASTHMLTGQALGFDSLSPSRGPKAGNTLVTIHGQGFGSVSQGGVLFGTTAALAVTPAAGGLSLTCLSPAHATGAVDVVITGIGTLTAAYTYISVDRVTPSGGPVAGGTAVTVTGFGFNLASGVTFDGIAATNVVIVSNTTITCTTPAHQSGAVDVAVLGVDTGSLLYTYVLGQALLPPIPVLVPITQNGTSSDQINAGWIRWLTTLKQRIETPPSIGTEQVTGASALTAVSDSNVTLALSGTPATALLEPVTATLGWVGHLPVTRGGTGLGAVAAGDLLYGPSAQRLAALTIGSATTFLKSVGGFPAWTAGAALTKTDDTNVTLTLAGSASTALVNAASLTLGWTGQLAVPRGGTGLATIASGGLLYGSALDTLSVRTIGNAGDVLTPSGGFPAWSALSGLGTGNLSKADDTNVTLALGGTPTGSLFKSVSITAGWTGTLALARGGSAADLSGTGGTKQYVKQATLGGAFTVGTIPASDIASGAALTKADDTNVTLTLGGTPTTALLVAASISAGWTGTLAVARGGIGVGTLASNGVLYGNATSAVQALAVNSTATTKFLSQVSSGVPAWAQPAIADLSDGTNVAKLNAANAFTGSGTMSFSAARTGAQLFTVTNSAAGTANSAGLQIINDLANAATLQVFSSTFTPSGDGLADGARFIFGGAGGLSITAVNAAGVIRFYTNGFSERMRLFASGGVSIGNTTDPGVGNLSVTNTLSAGAASITTQIACNQLGSIAGNVLISTGTPTITAHTGGTGPTISGIDCSFRVVTNGATSVTVTFGQLFNHAPNIGISVDSTGITTNVASTTTTATIVLGGGSADFMAVCIGY